MSEQINRLKWKCRRGMRELDLLLKEFSENEMLNLSSDDHGTFDEVLNYDDQTLYDFIFKKLIISTLQHERFINNKLKKFTKLENFLSITSSH